MKIYLTLGVVAVAVAAHAQSYSSFHAISGLHGIDIMQSNSNPLDFTISMDSVAADNYLTVGGQNYQISNVFGFYAIASSGFSSASGSSQNSWSFSAPGNKEVAGWKGNPSQSAILPGGSLSFAFGALSPNEGQLGLHVSFASTTPSQWGGGNTFYVNTNQSVPEPSSLAFLAGAPLSLLLKKKKI